MPVKNAKVIKAVAEAARINRSMKESAERLEALKEVIRVEAASIAVLGDDGKPEKVEFESVEGVCTVAFPKDKVAFIKGGNPETLRAYLTSVTYDDMFQTKIVFGDTFEDTFELLSKTQKRAVKNVVEWKPSTPTVTLPK